MPATLKRRGLALHRAFCGAASLPHLLEIFFVKSLACEAFTKKISRSKVFLADGRKTPATADIRLPWPFLAVLCPTQRTAKNGQGRLVSGRRLFSAGVWFRPFAYTCFLANPFGFAWNLYASTLTRKDRPAAIYPKPRQ